MKKLCGVVALLLMLALLAGCQNAPAPGSEPSVTPPPGGGAFASPTLPPLGTEPSKSDVLTPEDAAQIALKHAGLTREQVTRLSVEKDYFGQAPCFDVEFHCNGFEYDFEIDVYSGKILNVEKEPD